MKFVIISHVNHVVQNNQIFGYGPYVREMNIWLKNVNKVEVSDAALAFLPKLKNIKYVIRLHGGASFFCRRRK